MADLSVLLDREGRTLTVWFGDRLQEYVGKETGDEFVLMKDSAGRVIGFEKLNFSISETDQLHVVVETAPSEEGPLTATPEPRRLFHRGSNRRRRRRRRSASGT